MRVRAGQRADQHDAADQEQIRQQAALEREKNTRVFLNRADEGKYERKKHERTKLLLDIFKEVQDAGTRNRPEMPCKIGEHHNRQQYEAFLTPADDHNCQNKHQKAEETKDRQQGVRKL